MVVLTFGLILPIQAQESDFGNWLIYIGNKKINQKWDIHHEIQYRNYNVAGDLEQLLLRTGIGRTFNNNKSNVLLGYGYILSENYTGIESEKLAINEHRIFQQFISKQKIKVVNLNHRYRFEQRFVESNYKMRFRYFLGISIPVITTENRQWYLSGYNEIFINTNTPKFDRNRIYGGLGLKLSDNVKLECGYMNQIFETGNRDQFNIIGFVNF